MVAARIVKYCQIVVLIYLFIYLFIYLVLIAVWGSYFISFFFDRFVAYNSFPRTHAVSTVQILLKELLKHVCKSPNFFIHYCVCLALLCGS